MPKLNLFDRHGRALELVGKDGIPPNVAVIVVSRSFPRSTCVSYDTLMKVLDLPGKLKKITIVGVHDDASPQRLAFLTACFSKTESLYLYDISHLEEFEHIVSGLSQSNGLKELHLKIPCSQHSIRESVVSNDILRMLLRGLSSSSSLEKLHLVARNSLDEDDLGNELTSAIRGIRRLKILILDVCWAENHLLLQAVLRSALLDVQVKDFYLVDGFGGRRSPAVSHHEVWVETFRNPRCVLQKFRLDIRWTEENRMSLQRIFCSAILDAKIKELVLFNFNFVGWPVMIDHDVWVNTLCRQDCALEKLDLKGIKLDNYEESSEGTSTGPEPTAKNSSVKDLQITWAKLKCPGAREILSRFQSLESLYLRPNNSIQTISLFNNVLLRDESTMKRLAVELIDFQEDDLKSFLSQIPQMKSLKALHLRIKDREHGWNDLLEKAVLRNTSLQQVTFLHCGSKRSRFRERDGYIDKNLRVWLSLNRAGQGFLQNAAISLSLWPLILERAGKIYYYYERDTWERPSLADTRVDAVYWLLREKFFLG